MQGPMWHRSLHIIVIRKHFNVTGKKNGLPMAAPMIGLFKFL